jgi:hypothetical protein
MRSATAIPINGISFASFRRFWTVAASPDDSSLFHDLSVGLTDCCTLDQLSDRNASDFDALATATSRTSRL